MSPSWRERVRIVLAPSSVELTRFRRGLRPSAAHKTAVPVESGSSWEDPMAVLEPLLAEPRWRNAEAEVLLSSHFVRLHLLPWSESLATDAERLAHARAELEGVHGERARDWTLALDDAPVGQAAPVCAIDTALLDAVRVKCQAASLKVHSIRPYFAAVLDDHRTRLRARNCGFAFCETGRLTLALHESGACRWLANPRVGVALSEAVAAEIRQAEALGSISGSGQLHVAFAGPPQALPGQIAGWDVVALEGATGPVGGRQLPDVRLATEL